MAFPVGAALGAGATIIGGLLDSNSTNKANQQNIAMQKQFAQNGIQWKVKDAIEAGIHPLYAMGAQTTSFQPTSVGGGDFGIAEAGQNIGRAIDATRSTPASDLAMKATAAQIQGLNLDNELKAVQLASAIRLANQTGPHPALPSSNDVYPLPGQGDSGVISSVPPGHDPRAPQYTTPNLALEGHTWLRRPGTSDAQTWEDVYGDEAILPAIVNNYNSYMDMLLNSSQAYRKHIITKLRR